MNSSSTSNPLINSCLDIGSVLTFSFAVVKAILIIPLSILVLSLGQQRQQWRKPIKSLSHSEVFSYHLAAMELFWGPGLICNVCGIHLQSLTFITLAGSLYSFTFYAEGFFHILTCVDRYLAVVHPIFYRQMRSSRGIKSRNISISCAWILSLGFVCFYMDTTFNCVIFSMLCFVVVTIIIITYCSLSVLCALIRPGPGEGGGNKERVDQLKQRAFYTITAILGVLCLWLLGLFAATAVSQLDFVDAVVRCTARVCVLWFSLPTSLVSPLLYLHRSNKLLFICSNPQ